jgi:hypothetical protein
MELNPRRLGSLSTSLYPGGGEAGCLTVSGRYRFIGSDVIATSRAYARQHRSEVPGSLRGAKLPQR